LTIFLYINGDIFPALLLTLMADSKTGLSASAARSLTKNPLLLLPRNLKTVTTALTGLLSFSNFLSPNSPITQRGKELIPSATSLLSLAEPVITQANPGSDLSFGLGKVQPLLSGTASGDQPDNFSLFISVASSLVPLAAGLRRRSGSPLSAPSSSASDEGGSDHFKFDTSSASHDIYLPKFCAHNHLWHLPNLYKATSSLVEAVWSLYYKSGLPSEFEREVASANQIVQEAVTGYVSSRSASGQYHLAVPSPWQYHPLVGISA
jgi:hypothetical protein